MVVQISVLKHRAAIVRLRLCSCLTSQIIDYIGRGTGRLINMRSHGLHTGSQGMHIGGSHGLHCTCAQGSHDQADEPPVRKTCCGGCCRAVWNGEPMRHQSVKPLPLVVQPIFTEDKNRATAQSNANFFMIQSPKMGGQVLVI